MKKLLLLFCLISSFSIQAMHTDSSTEEGSGNKKSSQSQNKVRCTPRKVVATFALGCLALNAGTQVWSGVEIDNVIEASSPITMYPGWTNCTAESNIHCTADWPNITHREGCDYDQSIFSSKSDMPPYAEGTCCHEKREKGEECACVVEKCEGAGAFTSAIRNLIRSRIVNGVSVALTASYVIFHRYVK